MWVIAHFLLNTWQNPQVPWARKADRIPIPIRPSVDGPPTRCVQAPRGLARGPRRGLSRSKGRSKSKPHGLVSTDSGRPGDADTDTGGRRRGACCGWTGALDCMQGMQLIGPLTQGLSHNLEISSWLFLLEHLRRASASLNQVAPDAELGGCAADTSHKQPRQGPFLRLKALAHVRRLMHQVKQ